MGWAWLMTRLPCSWTAAGWRSAAGPDFGRQGHGFARLNMGTSPELLTEAVHRMAAATR